MIRRRPLLLGLPALPALAACEADRPAAVAAGHGPDEGGIGGTGILGVVAPGATAGRLLVSGILLDPLGAPLPPAGEVLVVQAERRDGRLVATRLAAFQPLVGPSRLLDQGRAEVLGTRVLFGSHTQMPIPRALGGGRPVAVSGIWQGDAVLATRIVPAGGGGVTLRRLAVLAVVAPDETGPGRHLAGFGLPIDPASTAVLQPGRPALLLGERGARLAVAHSLPLANPAQEAGAAGQEILRRWLELG